MAFKKKGTITADQFKAIGQSAAPGATTVTVLLRNSADLILFATGTTVPGAETGYAKSCLFIKTDAGTGVAGLYENIGTTSSASFNLIGSISAGEITLATGSILVGTAGVAAALDAKTSGQILVGNGTTVVSVPLSGDAALSSTGVITIGANVVSLAKFARSDAPGKFVVGQGAGSDAQYATMSGDATMDGSGAVTIANGAVSPAKQTTAARTRVAVIPFSLPAPTGSDQNGLARANFVCSQALTVVSVKIFSTTATTGADATNHYEFMARNATGAANLHTGTTSTQTGEIAANTAYTVTVSQNLSFTANQVFQLNVDIKDDGSAGPTNLSAADLSCVLEYTV